MIILLKFYTEVVQNKNTLLGNIITLKLYLIIIYELYKTKFLFLYYKIKK